MCKYSSLGDLVYQDFSKASAVVWVVVLGAFPPKHLNSFMLLVFCLFCSKASVWIGPELFPPGSLT